MRNILVTNTPLPQIYFCNWGRIAIDVPLNNFNVPLSRSALRQQMIRCLGTEIWKARNVTKECGTFITITQFHMNTTSEYNTLAFRPICLAQARGPKTPAFMITFVTEWIRLLAKQNMDPEVFLQFFFITIQK